MNKYLIIWVIYSIVWLLTSFMVCFVNPSISLLLVLLGGIVYLLLGVLVMAELINELI